MSCHEAREWFSDWADQALTPEERARLDTHLEGCADCRRELDRFMQTVSLLHQVEPPRAPVGFVDRVLAATRPLPWHRRLRERFALSLPVKLPVEAAAVVLIATLAVYVFQKAPELQQAARQEPPPSVSSESARSRQVEPPAPVLEDKPLEARPAPAVPRVAPQPPREKSPETPQGERGELRRESRDAKGAAPEAATPRMAEGIAPTASPPSPVAPASSPALTAKKEAPAEGSAASRPPAPSAMRVLPSANVVGRLTVRDRQAAERDLAELLTRLGGMEIARRPEAGATVVDVVVPQPSYAEFTRGLARMGSWLPDAEPSELPARIAITLRISE